MVLAASAASVSVESGDRRDLASPEVEEERRRAAALQKLSMSSCPYFLADSQDSLRFNSAVAI